LAIRDRETHAKKLKGQLDEIQNELDETKEELGLKGDYGIHVEFESEPNFELKIDSLERLRSGIELENVRILNNTTYATVYIPEGKIKHFFNIIDKYLTQNVKNKEIAKNKELVESISNIKSATLKAFWTDFENLDNISNDEIKWWEVWLRNGNSQGEREKIFNEFQNFAEKNKILLSDTRLIFPERTIILVKTSKGQLSESILFLNCLAELKLPHDTPETFMQMNIGEQREWINEILRRTTLPSMDAPAICILDSGINRAHPLIEPALNQNDMHTYNPAWGSNDSDGHGTGMAGLALYGDLYDILISTSKINLNHRLESVKLFFNPSANPPELYGSITQECIARAEIEAPFRKRIVCLATSSREKRYKGSPSSWSSAVDQKCFGSLDDSKSLILVASGNLAFNQIANYPNENKAESIHNPGQSWNAITIGAMTNKNYINQSKWPNYIPIAPLGSLSPASTTSYTWEEKWPIKPDIVLEGGNLGKESISSSYDFLDSLQLLTTHHQPLSRLFAVFGDTSAATAIASRLAALILVEYPDLWPETIRALLINSASWTANMLDGVELERANSNTKKNILRIYGYGIPDIKRAIWSLKNNLTLIYQSSLQPFLKEENVIKTNEINYHNLPVPSDVLRGMGFTDIEMKITLSYFIEPNPSNRKYFGKYDYQSCGLNFDIRKGAEDIETFKRRINGLSRDGNETYSSGGLHWVLGPNARNRGSIHSDIWKGKAADLADMDLIAVYPVTGWWRTRKQLKKWENKIRYSLVVSIKVEDVNVDIYTLIRTMITNMVQIS